MNNENCGHSYEDAAETEELIDPFIKQFVPECDLFQRLTNESAQLAISIRGHFERRAFTEIAHRMAKVQILLNQTRALISRDGPDFVGIWMDYYITKARKENEKCEPS